MLAEQAKSACHFALKRFRDPRFRRPQLLAEERCQGPGLEILLEAEVLQGVGIPCFCTTQRARRFLIGGAEGLLERCDHPVIESTIDIDKLVRDALGRIRLAQAEFTAQVIEIDGEVGTLDQDGAQ